MTETAAGLLEKWQEKQMFMEELPLASWERMMYTEFIISYIRIGNAYTKMVSINPNPYEYTGDLQVEGGRYP